MPDTSHLYTTVKNPTAAALTYGYLGRHGKTLAAAGTYTFLGDIGTQLLTGHGKYGRRRASFEADLLAGRIEVLQTPALLMQNTTPDAIIANPTVQATAAASTGGSMAVGFYKIAYTFVSAWGETTVGASLSASHEVVDATNDRIVATVPAASGVTNATAVNVYITAMSALTGTVDATTLRKVGQVTGATTTLNIDTLPAIHATNNPQPPTTNTTKAPVVFAVGVTDATLGVVDPSWGRLT